jgi:hypothetical protein
MGVDDVSRRSAAKHAVRTGGLARLVDRQYQRRGGKVLVEVGPGLAGRTWRVTVQHLSASGGWVAVSMQTTSGPGDTLRLHLPNGTYRAMVPPQHRYRGSVSGAVVLGE